MFLCPAIVVGVSAAHVAVAVAIAVAVGEQIAF